MPELMLQVVSGAKHVSCANRSMEQVVSNPELFGFSFV